MPLQPKLKALFDAQRSSPPMPTGLGPAQLRSQMHAMMEQSFFAFATPHEAVAIERDIIIPGPGGEIALRLYRAVASESETPCHVYYHGGGFFLGTLDHSDTACRALASDLGCTVISVDYRLAPEHRFPAAVEDAYAALCWSSDHAAELRINASCISVGGGSAGGNLAAVVCQMARDRNGPAIVAQVLEIPVTDFTSDRVLDFPDEDIVIESAKKYAPIYLRGDADARNPLASPLARRKAKRSASRIGDVRGV
ncbi:alpha/beta hydrolase [Novosphingobium sp. G106]|nr:alpha/beta hydrolase [Novosphingobium sp. G106]